MERKKYQGQQNFRSIWGAPPRKRKPRERRATGWLRDTSGPGYRVPDLGPGCFLGNCSLPGSDSPAYSLLLCIGQGLHFTCVVRRVLRLKSQWLSGLKSPQPAKFSGAMQVSAICFPGSPPSGAVAWVSAGSSTIRTYIRSSRACRSLANWWRAPGFIFYN